MRSVALGRVAADTPPWPGAVWPVICDKTPHDAVGLVNIQRKARVTHGEVAPLHLSGLTALVVDDVKQMRVLWRSLLSPLELENVLGPLTPSAPLKF